MTTFSLLPTYNNFLSNLPLPIKNYCLNSSKLDSLHKTSLNIRSYGNISKGFLWGHKNYCLNYSKFGSLHETRLNLSRGFLWGESVLKGKERVVLVKSNQRFNFNGGGNNGRVLGNLALAIGLTYLSFSGQLGWVLDAIVSLWLLSIVLPIVGFGLFLWWAKRDVVQSACPNCGNEFQVFKSSLNDELQLCLFCSQPFSVEGNEFVKEPINFSNRSTPFGQAFDKFSPLSGKGKEASTAIVDVEAEVKDAE